MIVLPALEIADVVNKEHVDAAVDAWIERHGQHPDVVECVKTFDLFPYIKGSARQCFDMASNDVLAGVKKTASLEFSHKMFSLTISVNVL